MTYAASQAQPLIDRTIKKGISIKTIAEKSDVSIRTVSRLRNGHTVSEVSALAVLSGLGVIWAERKEARLAKQETAKTLDTTVEQLAVQCIDADLTHVRDTDLECAKYRRVMRLEQQLNDANTAYLSSKSQHDRDLQRLNDAQDKLEYMKLLAGEDGRKLQDYQAQISKAEAMILGLNESNECLQKQLDHGQVVYSKLCSQLGATRAKYEAQLEAVNQKEVRLQEQLTEVYATKTRQEAQVMRLRAYVWILIAALALVVVSGLVVWGGV